MKTLAAALAAILTGWLVVNLIGALIVGAIARAILPGKDRVGWFTTILVGFLGGIVGKIVAFLFGFRRLGWLGGFVVSVLGAIGLLIAHRVWRGNKGAGRAAAPQA
jgi:uncharacterized membrane protein YeaQ/YmgE (transglycosylase-associated protein family)